MEHKTIDLLNWGMYHSKNIQEMELNEILNVLVFYEELNRELYSTSIDCFCVVCEKPTTFKSRNSDYKITSDLCSSKKSCDLKPYLREGFEKDIHEIEFFTRSFYCPRFPKNNEHDVSFIFRVVNGNITKIGQFPQLANIENSHLTKYKKLESEIYKELNRAVGLYSHGIGVGAFVYLRRIIEKFILKPELDELVSIGSITNDELFLLKFKAKIALVKDQLPDFLVENKNLYSILSKGIHSMTEEECLEHFPSLLTAIEIILDEKIETIEKDEKKTKLKVQLGAIATKSA